MTVVQSGEKKVSGSAVFFWLKKAHPIIYMEPLPVDDTNIVEDSAAIGPKKYLSAVIYVLQCIDNYYYIGSTVNHPRFRLNNHKNDSVKYPDRPIYDHILRIGWDNVLLQVVEEYPCDTKKELQLKEDQYIKESIRDEYCLNHIRANVAPEERKENVKNYYLTHREQILKQHAEYIESNKQNVDAYQAAYRKENAEGRREYSRQYAADHPEQVAAYRREYYEANKEEAIRKQKAYVEANKEAVKQRKREWAAKNRELIAEKNRAYIEANKEKRKEVGKAYYAANKETIQQKNNAYREANLESLAAKQKAYLEKVKGKLSESHTCDCGGKYTANHAKIHMSSKRHMKHLASASP